MKSALTPALSHRMGEGVIDHTSANFDILRCHIRLLSNLETNCAKLEEVNISKMRRNFLPLLGERAGVRADV
jgi:hypothetical protein